MLFLLIITTIENESFNILAANIYKKTTLKIFS